MCKNLLLFLFNAKKKRRVPSVRRPRSAPGGVGACVVHRLSPSLFLSRWKEGLILSAPGPFAPAKMWDKNCKPACFCGMINSKPFSRRRRDFRFCAKKNSHASRHGRFFRVYRSLGCQSLSLKIRSSRSVYLLFIILYPPFH